jgi:hypothetical protein
MLEAVVRVQPKEVLAELAGQAVVALAALVHHQAQQAQRERQILALEEVAVVTMPQVMVVRLAVLAVLA